jgi:hypothetical protein
MKKLLTILLLFLSLNLSAQKSESWKTISIYTTSILTGAVGDALNDSGHKDWGHACNATSIGLLLISPKLMNYEKKKWGWYVASYIGLRVAMFDPAYNLTRGLPFDYVGGTSFWDKGIKSLNPPNTYFFRGVYLTFGISIPLNEIK